MTGVSNVDPKSARETTLTALVSAVNALAGNLAAESTFTSMLTELQDILLELDQKVNEEGTIHLDPADIASLRLVTATVLGMPTDYPDAATHAAIATTNTDLAAGNALLTSILGETGDIDTLAGEMHAQLSTIVTALGSYLSTLAGAVTASILQANNAQVGGTAIDTNSGNKSGGTQRVVLATDQPALSTPLPISAASLPLPAGAALDATLTSGAQLAKITNGTQAADTIAGDSGHNSLFVAPPTKLINISATSTGRISWDADGYQSYVLTGISGTAVGTIQGSNDNTNWVSIPGTNPSSPGALLTGSTTLSTSGIMGHLPYRYLSINLTSVTNWVATIGLRGFPNPSLAAIASAIQSGTWTVQPGNSQNTTPWVVSGLTATQSLNAVTTATTGATKALGGTMKCQGMQVIVGGTGALSALSVVLEGSLDGGTTWFTLATYSTATSGYIASNNQPCQTLRARAVTVTASSGTPTVTAYVCAA